MHKETIVIKGTKKGLVFHFNTKEASFEELKNALLEKFQDSKGFFDKAKFMISQDSALSPEETAIIEDICDKHGMIKCEPEAVLESSQISEKNSVPDDIEYVTTKGNAVLVTKSLRSGQKIYVAGHAVITGDVNPGAQVVATGSIIVMGTFRGIAHAGSSGDESAYVMAYRLRPAQIGIGDKLTRAPEQEKAADYPEMAMIVDDQIIVKPYQTSKRNIVN